MRILPYKLVKSSTVLKAVSVTMEKITPLFNAKSQTAFNKTASESEFSVMLLKKTAFVDKTFLIFLKGKLNGDSIAP